MLQELLVGLQQRISNGVATKARGTSDGAAVVTNLHGKYYEQASRGRAFYGSSASAGIAIIVPATTGGHPTLWNPSDSGVNVNIIRVELSYVSGNHAPGAFEWALTTNTGSNVATGAPIASATLVDAVPCVVGSGFAAKARWSPTSNTFTAAPTFTRALGVGLHTGVAATATNPTEIRVDYDGDFGLAPGNAVSLCYQTTTTTALFQVTVAWEEIPV